MWPFFFYTSSNKIVLGKGNIVDAADGYVKFAKEKGDKKTEVGYGIKVKDKNEGKRSGHFISILGYVRAQKISSGNTWN